MATYVWNRTREQVRNMILRKLGILGIGDDVTAEDSVVVFEAIDARLKELDATNMLWWNVSGSTSTVAVTAGDATVSIAPADFLYPMSATVLVGTNEKTLTVLDHLQYQAIPDKTQTGEPESVFIDGSTATLWPVPSVNTTFALTYQAITADLEQGQPIDVPAAAIRALVDLVAGDLVDDFGVPSERAARLTAKQGAAVRTLRKISQQRADTATVTAEYY